MVPDLDSLVAVVDIGPKKTDLLDVFDKVYEERLRRLFSGPVSVFGGGGRNPDDGVFFDSTQTYQPWDEGYMRALGQVLRELNLTYVQVEERVVRDLERGFFSRMRARRAHR